MALISFLFWAVPEGLRNTLCFPIGRGSLAGSHHLRDRLGGVQREQTAHCRHEWCPFCGVWDHVFVQRPKHDQFRTHKYGVVHIVALGQLCRFFTNGLLSGGAERLRMPMGMRKRFLSQEAAVAGKNAARERSRSLWGSLCLPMSSRCLHVQLLFLFVLSSRWLASYVDACINNYSFLFLSPHLLQSVLLLFALF